jgi:uncharacterized membrane protein YbhN (UPF0104 family)
MLRPVFALVALAFVVHAGLGLYESWDGNSVDVDPLLFASAVVVAGLAMLVQMVAWRGLMRSFTGSTMPASRSARLYLDSQMARYTPGKVGLAVVRIAGAKSVGVPSKTMASALLAEVVSWCAMGAVVGGVALFFLPGAQGVAASLSWGGIVFALGAAGGLGLAVLVDRQRYPEKLRGLVGEDTRGPLVPWTLPALHLVHFFLWVVCGALVALSVGASLQVGLVAGALLCLAIVAGFLALLAPAGAGVREAVLAAGLVPLLGASTSIAIGILARIASLVSDVILWAWFRARSSKS